MISQAVRTCGYSENVALAHRVRNINSRHEKKEREGKFRATFRKVSK